MSLGEDGKIYFTVGWTFEKNGKRYGDFIIMNEWPPGKEELDKITEILQSQAERSLELL